MDVGIDRYHLEAAGVEVDVDVEELAALRTSTRRQASVWEEAASRGRFGYYVVMSSRAEDVTRWLNAWSRGDHDYAEPLVLLIYDELRGLASQRAQRR